MENLSLQFQGTGDNSLLLLVLAAVMMLLAAWAVVQFVGRRWRYGALCLAAALGPATAVGALVVDTVRKYADGNGRGAKASLTAALALVAGSLLALALALGSRTSGAIWMAALGIEVILAVGVFYSAVYAHLGTGRMTALMALRCAAILALLLVLFKPVITMTPSGADKPYLEVLVDRSGSMATIDEANVPTRYAQAVQMLAGQRARIEKHFRPVWRHFAASAYSADSLDEMARLTPSGEGTGGTNLAAAIRTAATEYPKGDVAGVILISDGIHNAPDLYTEAADQAGLPIHTVAVGSTSEKFAGRKNLQLVSVEAPLEAVVNNITTVKANIRITGYPDTTNQVRLAEEGLPAPLIEQRTATGNVFTDTVAFRWTPRDAAPRTATAPSAAVRKLKVTLGPQPGEAVADDNETEVHVLLTNPRIRVLYIEGTMRPEYRFLKRFLEKDPNVEFMGMVRTAPVGNRFWAQGSLGGKQLATLPATDDDFKLFDVLILGDVDRTFLTDNQMARVRQFVNDGGGLIMTGGRNSFGPGGYADTDIEKAMPVMMGNRSTPQETTEFVPQLTAVGQAHPIFEGLSGFFHGPGGAKPDDKLPKLPNLTGCVTVPSVKPGAMVLAIHPSRSNESGPLTVLAAQPFGAGRTVAFTADTTWNWDLAMKAAGVESPYERFWGQLLRWTAGVDTKTRQTASACVLRIESCYAQVGDAVKVLARVQDTKGQAPESAQVTVNVVGADRGGQGEQVDMKPGAGRGLFEGTWRPKAEGRFTIKATAVGGSDKAQLGADELPLKVERHQAEMDRLARDDGPLQLIADRSGGNFAQLSALPDLIDRIIERQQSRAAPSPQSHNFPSYDPAALGLIFFGFVAILTAEWMLRRNWQLH
ncbi:MAG: glutamine amidotransferase [Phycisphaerae bacterium]